MATLPDTQNIADFEGGYAALLDTLDQLRQIPVPAESEDVKGLIEWHKAFKGILSSMPEVPDPDSLTRFAESVDQEIKELRDKVGGDAGPRSGDLRDDGLLLRLEVFAVKVTKDGGYAGAPDPGGSNCSWTYTVKDLYGNSLGTTVAPQRARYTKTIYTQAPDNSYGLAAYDGETLKLLVCFSEIEQTDVCP